MIGPNNWGLKQSNDLQVIGFLFVKSWIVHGQIHKEEGTNRRKLDSIDRMKLREELS